MAPAGPFAPVSPAEFGALAARTLPPGPELLSVRWRFQDATASVSGRGAVRVAPPDSLRIDVRGPLGFGRATLVLAGDSAWAEPTSMVRQVLPVRFIVWAMLGVLRAPDAAARLEAYAEGERRLVRVVEGGGRATTFELEGALLRAASLTRDDRLVGRLVLHRDAAERIVRAEVENRERDARLVFEIEGREHSAPFDPAVWRRP